MKKEILIIMLMVLSSCTTVYVEEKVEKNYVYAQSSFEDVYSDDVYMRCYNDEGYFEPNGTNYYYFSIWKDNSRPIEKFIDDSEQIYYEVTYPYFEIDYQFPTEFNSCRLDVNLEVTYSKAGNEYKTVCEVFDHETLTSPIFINFYEEVDRIVKNCLTTKVIW